MSKSIKLIKDNYSTIGPDRHYIAQQVILKYSSSDNPLDNLAVAMAYEWEGSKFRKDSINYYELYLNSNIKTTLFDEWLIYSSLATLHEKEYQFEKSLECLNKLILLNQGENSSDFTRIGNIYVKQDINKAVNYYENLIKSPMYNMHKHSFDCAYKAVKEKQLKGYVYKPRNKSK